MTKRKGTILSTPLSIAALVIIIVVGVYLALTIKQANEVEEPVTSMSNSTAPSNNTTPVTDETADWKTYTNDEYGFSFKYPKDWEIKNISNSVIELRERGKTYSIEESDIYAIRVGVGENQDSKTAVDLQTEFNKNKLENNIVQIIQIDGIDAVQTTNYLQKSTQVIRNSKIYTLSTPELGSEVLTKQIRTVYDQILATFRFNSK